MQFSLFFPSLMLAPYLCYSNLSHHQAQRRLTAAGGGSCDPRLPMCPRSGITVAGSLPRGPFQQGRSKTSLSGSDLSVGIEAIIASDGVGDLRRGLAETQINDEIVICPFPREARPQVSSARVCLLTRQAVMSKALLQDVTRSRCRLACFESSSLDRPQARDAAL